MHISEAAWESFLDKRIVCSANLDYTIQKTINNMRSERRPRCRPVLLDEEELESDGLDQSTVDAEDGLGVAESLQ